MRKKSPSEALSTPTSFPWPPPRASAASNFSNEFFRTSQNAFLRDIDNRLSDALTDAGYVEKSYYAVLDGFALVARLEQINRDGTPKSGSDRWAVDFKPFKEFTLSSYIKALFTKNAGYFRVIVFIVTPHPFSQSDLEISRREAIAWVSRGFNRLPISIGKKRYTEEYACTALIYEFEKRRGKDTANTLIPGRLTALTHLEKSAIIIGLRK